MGVSGKMQRGIHKASLVFGIETAELKLKEKEITSSVTQGQRVMHSPDSFSPKLEHMCDRTQRP